MALFRNFYIYIHVIALADVYYSVAEVFTNHNYYQFKAVYKSINKKMSTLRLLQHSGTNINQLTHEIM